MMYIGPSDIMWKQLPSEVQVAIVCVFSMFRHFQNEIPTVRKQKKNLDKLTLDMDAAKTK